MDNPLKIDKPTYGLPQALFPSDEILERWYKEGMSTMTPFEKEFRTIAFTAYAQFAAPDKELTRFMIPSVSWPEVEQKSSSLNSLGGRSWIASLDKAPFVPEVCKEFLMSFSQESRSLVHLIGATFTRMRILYITESLNEVILENSSYGREVLFVIVEPGISVKILDRVHAQGLSARVVIGSIAQGSQVGWVSDHSADSSSDLLQHDRWYQDKGSQLEIAQVLTGGKQSWLRKEFKLSEKAQLSYSCLAALQGDEQSALTTVQEHLGHSSTSSVLVKTALSERARSFYRGTIAIHPDSPQSVASQQHKALLLSPDARTCAIPSLEVATHEVQCAHGSAAGQFNEEELWYVRSKGFTPEQAKGLLIDGFFNEPVVIENPEMRERLRGRVLFRQGVIV